MTMLHTYREDIKGKELRAYDNAIYDVLSFLQTTPTEDFKNAEQYRKYLYREIMEW